MVGQLGDDATFIDRGCIMIKTYCNGIMYTHVIQSDTIAIICFSAQVLL